MKRLLIGTGIFLVALAVSTLAAGLIAKHWIIPDIISSRIQSAAAEEWAGELRIGSVEFSYSGPVLIHNIEFRDDSQRAWLHIDKVEVALRNWPGISPELAAVDIHQAAARSYFKNGHLDLPVRKQKTTISPRSEINLDRLSIHNISFTIVDDQADQATWSFDRFDAMRQNSGVYDVLLTAQPAGGMPLIHGENPIRLRGSIHPKTYNADLTLDANLWVDSSRMSVVLRAFDVPVIKGVEGRLNIEQARLRGRLNDPGLWQLDGEVGLEGFQFEGPYGQIAKELDSAMKLDGRTIRITQFSANGSGGQVAMKGHATIGTNWTMTYRGTLDAINVDVPMLTEVVAGPDKKAQRGTLSLQVRFSGVDGSLRGSGLLGLDNADVMTMSIFNEVFRQMGLGGNEQLRKSDVRAVLTFSGPQITIEQGRLANPLSAIDVERGGRINVQTHQLDLYAIGVPLKAVEGILNLPIIRTVSEPFRNLRDKLVRLHIKGDWSAPPSTIITKEPIKDISEGTLSFFQDVAKSGGKLGQGVLKTVNDVFRALGDGS